MRHPQHINHFFATVLTTMLSLIAMVAHAQSTMGADFWTSFMPNSSSEADELNLIATGARACSGNGSTASSTKGHSRRRNNRPSN